MRDEERMDQYHAIHAEVISLSTVSGGSCVAWQPGVARCWRGVAWHGVVWHGMVWAWYGMVWHGVARRARAVALAPSHLLALCFLPSSRSLSSSVSLSVCVCVCVRIVLPFFCVLRLDRSRSPSRPALTGVKIEPLWRASDSPYVRRY